ncbi:lipoprotein [Nitrosomonas sp.]|jgi:predicted small lipoprotein YifL|nr:lipoprotein [Nitrosomonas sp.]MBK6958780.1 lipoprotein [Nitrosomonas sp.]MDP1550463.1 lipoprotein [Nitrosomonas sp.]
MRLLIVILLSAYLLSACGLKGPLYLPKTDEASRAPSIETEKK